MSLCCLCRGDFIPTWFVGGAVEAVDALLVARCRTMAVILRIAPSYCAKKRWEHVLIYSGPRKRRVVSGKSGVLRCAASCVVP